MHTLNKFLTLGALALMPAISVAQVEGEAPVAEVPSESSINWIADFDEAQAIAKASGKDMLVDFTGSDWCVWCWRLEEQVYDFKSFQDYAAENFVMVLLDFPNSDEAKALVPNAARNMEINKQYGITGYPTVLLMNPDGDVYGKTGYRAGGPEEYVKYLSLLQNEGKAEIAAATALAAEWKAATTENQAAVYGRVLSSYAGFNAELMGRGLLQSAVMDVFTFDADNAAGLKLKAVEALIEAVAPSEVMFTAALELDPENTSGLKKRALDLMLGTGMVTNGVADAVMAMDPKNEAGLYEQLVASKAAAVRSVEQLGEVVAMIGAVEAMGFKSTEVQTGLFFNAAVWNWKYLDNAAEARRFGLALEALAEGDEQVAAMLSDMFGEIGREAALEEVEEEVIEEEMPK